MDFRTTFPIVPSRAPISPRSSLMFIGSCFASSVGEILERGKMKVIINPFGTVYNPASVHSAIDSIISGRVFNEADLVFHNDIWLSTNHYTLFESDTRDELLERINNTNRRAHEFLNTATHLFITFGTARVYRLRESGKIVSNCHKLPASMFTQELLTVDSIVNDWKSLLSKIHALFPALKVIFTISPVRHWKDGAHGNQVSKATLLLAVERLLEHESTPEYFPAYELVMDDLRDYRFYDADMLHLSPVAVDYIWQAFSAAWLSSDTVLQIKDITDIVRATEHRFITGSVKEKQKFSEAMLEKISRARQKYSEIDLSREIEYFNSIIRTNSQNI